MVLLWVQNLQKNILKISLVTFANFVDFVKQNDRIFRTSQFQGI